MASLIPRGQRPGNRWMESLMATLCLCAIAHHADADEHRSQRFSVTVPARLIVYQSEVTRSGSSRTFRVYPGTEMAVKISGGSSVRTLGFEKTSRFADAHVVILERGRLVMLQTVRPEATGPRDSLDSPVFARATDFSGTSLVRSVEPIDDALTVLTFSAL